MRHPKQLFRLIALLLAPAFLIDPASAAGLSPGLSSIQMSPLNTGDESKIQGAFQGQALTLALVQRVQSLDKKAKLISLHWQPRGHIKGPTVTADEERQLRLKIDRESDRVKEANPNAIEVAEKICRDFLHEKEFFLKQSLSDIGLTTNAIDQVIGMLRDPSHSFKWFRAIVRRSEWYLLGHERALAVDIVTTLWVADNDAPDHRVIEYILHEALENFLEHDQIIEFTSKFFGRTGYRKHGETPTGMVLRQFIDTETILYWNYEYIQAETYKRKKQPKDHPPQWEFRVDTEGKIDSQGGPYVIAVEWKTNGHLIIKRTELIGNEKGIERHHPYSGKLPDNLETSISRYHAVIDRNPFELKASLIEAKGLMLAQTLDRQEQLENLNRWLQVIKEQPDVLPLALQDFEKSSSLELEQAIIFLLRAYRQNSKKQIDDVFITLASENIENPRAILSAIKAGVEKIRRRPQHDYFYENTLELELTIAEIIARAPQTPASFSPMGIGKWPPFIVIIGISLALWSMTGRRVKAAFLERSPFSEISSREPGANRFPLATAV